MIEGITFHDRVRLEEVNIDNCYDLATADFVPLVFDTPYSARELTDWILQAKLCVYAPDAMLNLRQQGIRTIMDLEGLDQTQIQELVEATAVTKSALERALRSLKTDDEIHRLRHIGKRLGIFTGLEDTLLPLPGNGPVPAFPGTGLNEPAATFRDLRAGTTDPIRMRRPRTNGSRSRRVRMMGSTRYRRAQPGWANVRRKRQPSRLALRQSWAARERGRPR